MGVDEKVLLNEVGKSRIAIREQEFKRQQQEKNRANVQSPQSSDQVSDVQPQSEEVDSEKTEYVVSADLRKSTDRSTILEPFEKQVIRYVLKYGLVPLFDRENEDGTTEAVTVIDFVESEMAEDEIGFTTPIYNRLFEMAKELRMRYPADRQQAEERAKEKRTETWNEGEEKIRSEATSMDDIVLREKQLAERCDEVMNNYIFDFTANYVERILSSSDDDEARNLTAELVMEKHQLSKIHTKFAHVETELEQLQQLLPRAMFELKNAILLCDIDDLQSELKQEYSSPTPDGGKIHEIMNKLGMMLQLRAEFAKRMGERVVTPKKRVR